MMSAAGPAAAQAPFTSLPDGRYIVEFAGYRFALVPSRPRSETSVTLCFREEPDAPSSSREWERKTYWPFSRIVSDGEGFRRELAQAKSLSALQYASTTQLKTEAGDSPPAPVLAKDVRMFLDIDASRPEDQPCYRLGERGRRDPVADGPRVAFEWPDRDKLRVETFGPLTAHVGTENLYWASGKVEARDRGFPANHPLYVWCSCPTAANTKPAPIVSC